MNFNRAVTCSIKIASLLFSWMFSITTYASFIESTLGTAVVNDATASYYNPAALVLLKNRQAILQGTFANFRSNFTGQFTPTMTGMTESGSSNSNGKNNSPSIYFGIPASDKIIFGFAVVTNSATRGADENSILRYVQASNNIQDCDVVPALAIKINDKFAIGAGINFSYANFDSHPIIGFSGLNAIDTQSHNQSDGTGIGGNAGFLLRANPSTVIGFNYRSRTTYRLSGQSIYEGNPHLVSNSYHYISWVPARTVLSINHSVLPTLGFISTIQRIQWSALTNLHVYGVVNVNGTTPVILNGTVPQYLRDTWSLTLGSHLRVMPKWILRIAGSYNQSPGNPHYQLSNGDAVILGASSAYELNKMFTFDGSYAHGFVKDENININNSRYATNGVNKGWRDSISLKLTVNI
jgi:long-chain fatty acid transport protein